MKWYWLTGYDARVDVFLLHDLTRGQEPILRPEFSTVDRCRGCGKFNEQQVLNRGFDLDRIFRLPQDILSGTNDWLVTVVTEHFRDVCLRNNISGADFTPCGKRKSGDTLYLLWANHRSQCSEPVERWSRGTPLKDGEPPYYACQYCGLPERIIGYPHKTAMTFPDELTISIPSISTEMSRGPDFRFFCSDTIRKIFKAERVKGCCFSEMEQMEKRMAHHHEVRARLEAPPTDD